jgi:lipopolysaccharide/colanic/teichoic acid biosynthesis glycosyltransferase
MVDNADRVLEKCLSRDESLRREWEAQHKLRDDPRVTPLGRILRKTSLDELPQLWNVLRGEMSLVGPRPIVKAEVDKYATAYQQYIEVRPGLTGLWQVSGRNEATYEQRVRLDTYYVRNWSLWLDLYILCRTITVVVCCKGAY